MNVSQVGVVVSNNEETRILWRSDKRYNHRGAWYIFFVTMAYEKDGEQNVYVFCSDEHGNLETGWTMPGSYSGGLDHEKSKNDFITAVKSNPRV